MAVISAEEYGVAQLLEPEGHVVAPSTFTPEMRRKIDEIQRQIALDMLRGNVENGVPVFLSTAQGKYLPIEPRLRHGNTAAAKDKNLPEAPLQAKPEEKTATPALPPSSPFDALLNLTNNSNLTLEEVLELHEGDVSLEKIEAVAAEDIFALGTAMRGFFESTHIVPPTSGNGLHLWGRDESMHPTDFLHQGHIILLQISQKLKAAGYFNEDHDQAILTIFKTVFGKAMQSYLDQTQSMEQAGIFIGEVQEALDGYGQYIQDLSAPKGRAVQPARKDAGWISRREEDGNEVFIEQTGFASDPKGAKVGLEHRVEHLPHQRGVLDKLRERRAREASEGKERA